MLNISSLDLLIFAIVAIVFVVKFIRILGKRNDEEQPSAEEFFDAMQQNNIFSFGNKNNASDDTNDDMTIDVEAKIEEDTNQYGDSELTILDIKKLDPSFTVDGFLDKARMAFEIILSSYAEGDKETLQNLVQGDIAEKLSLSIDDRHEHGYVMEEKNLLGINEIEFISANLSGKIATIEVHFSSDQIYALYDSEGQVVEGDNHHSEQREDIWLFQKNMGHKKDPRWFLIDIRDAD